MTCNDTEWLQARLAKTEELIVAYEDAITALSSGTVMSYSIDTGQTRQSVTKHQLSQIENVLERLENRRAVLRAQLGCGHVYVRSAY
jgi:hypothetical protein